MNNRPPRVSSKHINPNLREEPLSVALAYCALPLAQVCLRLGLSPSAITVLSMLSALLSAIALAFTDWGVGFAALWFFSILLDFADGTVARTTATTSASGSFLDKFTDEIKLLLLPAACIWRHQSRTMVFLAVSAISLSNLVLYANCLCAERYRLLCSQQAGLSDPRQSLIFKTPPWRIKLKSFLERVHIAKYSLHLILRGTLNSFTAFSGNIFLYFLPFGFGEPAAGLALGTYGLVCLHSVIRSVQKCARINSELDKNHFKWK